MKAVSGKGFTLVEVLLALAILSAGLAVMLTGVSRCLAVMRSSRLHQEAEWAFCRAEADFPLERTNTVEAIRVESHEYDNGFVFTREAEEDEDEDGLIAVTIRVSRPAGEGGGSLEVVRYFLLQEALDEAIRNRQGGGAGAGAPAATNRTNRAR